MDDAPTLNVDRLLEHAGWARALARRLVADEQRADDVVQQAWLAAVQRPPRVQRHSQPHSEPHSETRDARTWLGRVIRNVAWKQHREDSRRETRERAAAVAESQPSSVAIVAELSAQRLVVDALMRLDEPYRETLVRRWYRDEKPAAIARAMDVPVRTVETRLARGLERLRAELTHLRGGDRRAWGLALVPLAVHAPGAAYAAGIAGGGTVLGTLAAGVGAMSVTMKIATAVLVLAAAGAWSWIRLRGVADVDARVGTVESRPVAGAVGESNIEGATSTADRVQLQKPLRPSTPTPSPGSLLVRVIDSSGNAVKASRLVLFRGDQWILSLDDGSPFDDLNGETLRIEPFDGEAAQLLVELASAPPCIVDVPAEAKEVLVRLPRGRVLTGTLFEEGRPLDWPGSMMFNPVQPFAVVRQLPPKLRSEIREVRTSLMTQSDAQGRFRFEGLDADVGGHLFVPWGWSTEPLVADTQGRLQAKQSLLLDGPEEGLRIDLYALPSIQGRVVTSDGSPVGRIRVWARAVDPRGFTGGASFDGGRFRMAIGLAGVPSLDLDIDGDLGSAFVHVDGPIAGRHDLGEIRLETNRTLEFRVVDSEGKPIEPAFGVFKGAHGGTRKLPIHAGVKIPESLDRARVGAFGYEAREIGLTRDVASSPIEVVLQATTILEVKVQDADGNPAEGVGGTVELAFTGPLFGSDAPASLKWIDTCEGSDAERCQQHDSGERRVLFDEDEDHVRLFGLVPGVAFHVRLRDAMGTVVFDEAVTLRAKESRVVVARNTRAQRFWKGRLIGPAGEPIAGAEIFLLSPDGTDGVGGYSNEDGSFAIEGTQDEVALRITASEYARVDRPRFRLPASEAETTIRMERAWPLEIEVVDAAGALLRGAEVTVFPLSENGEVVDSEGFSDSLMVNGRHLFRDLPAAPARVQVGLAGVRYEKEVAPPESIVRIDVPEHGRAVVRYDLPIPEATRAGRVLGAIELVPSGKEGAIVATDTTIYEPPRREGVVEIEFVLPGTYEIVLVWRDELGNDLERETTGGALEVAARLTTEFTLKR